MRNSCEAMRLQRSQEQKDLGMSELSFGVETLEKTYFEQKRNCSILLALKKASSATASVLSQTGYVTADCLDKETNSICAVE